MDLGRGKVRVTITLDMWEVHGLHDKLNDFVREYDLGPVTAEALHRAIENGPICDAILGGKADITITT